MFHIELNLLELRSLQLILQAFLYVGRSIGDRGDCSRRR